MPGGPAHIVFVTQLYDPDDPVLGFVPGWVDALAHRRQVTVIANEVPVHVARPPGPEVVSLGKETGAGKALRGLRYQAALARLAASRRPLAVVAHMCPAYLTLAAPLARTARARTLLWFAHPADSRSLRTAERLAAVVLTSLPGAYPRPGPKVRVIGQAIDTALFDHLSPPPDGPPRLLALGRTSPSKNYRDLLDGAALARERGVDFSLRIVGPSTTAEERRHRQEIVEAIDGLGLAGRVWMDDAVGRAGVPAAIRASTALVNATRAGSGDKVVLEAMAGGRPAIVSNPSFSEVVPPSLRFAEGDAAGLADRITYLASLSAPEVHALGMALRQGVTENHSLDHWAESVVRIAEEPGSPSRRPR